MAKILAFRPGEMRREASGLACGGASAEVIVFPGVRYERWDAAEGAHSELASAKKRGSGRQRDVLELAE
jgi:hypothetical protein